MTMIKLQLKGVKEFALFSIVLTSLFTFFDWLAHITGIIPDLGQAHFPFLETLPAYYFLFKIISVPMMLFTLVWLFSRVRKKQLPIGNFWKLGIIYAIVALALQVRYSFIGGYTLATNLYMMFIHFGMLSLAGLAYFTTRRILK